VGDVQWVSPDFELFPWVGGRRRQFGSALKIKTDKIKINQCRSKN
jgi:hypothetical protein